MTCAPPPDELVDRFRRDLAAVAGGAADPFALAVSGGPDSLALLLLAAAAFPGRVSAATVDHGLRPESAAEAASVARLCAGLGVPHSTLRAEVAATGEGVQAAARAARYSALGAWMAGRGLAVLLTAHHSDDQAETLLMRLQRGSGVAGLAGVRPSLPCPGADGALRVCRPLLGWRRAELAAIVSAAGLEPADDPSNSDESYDRTRIRRRLAETEWLDVAALARSAAALAEAEEALAAAADALAAERIATLGEALLLRPDGVPAELLRRLVRSCLLRLAPDAEPRGEQIGALLADLRSGRSATLAGIKASAGAGIWRFERAPPRRRR